MGSALRRALQECLPLDAIRRRESRVYLAFAARAMVSPDLSEVQRHMLVGLRKQCAAAFRQARERGEAVTDFDPAEAAAATAALVDGLLLHLLTDPAGMRPKAAIRILDAHLRRYVDLGDDRDRSAP